MRYLYFVLIFIFFLCSNTHDKYFKLIEGSWLIDVFYHFDEDLKDKRYYILGFERGNHSWMIKRENRRDEFISSKCKLYMHLDTLKWTLRTVKIHGLMRTIKFISILSKKMKNII